MFCLEEKEEQEEKNKRRKKKGSNIRLFFPPSDRFKTKMSNQVAISSNVAQTQIVGLPTTVTKRDIGVSNVISSKSWTLSQKIAQSIYNRTAITTRLATSVLTEYFPPDISTGYFVLVHFPPVQAQITQATPAQLTFNANGDESKVSSFTQELTETQKERVIEARADAILICSPPKEGENNLFVLFALGTSNGVLIPFLQDVFSRIAGDKYLRIPPSWEIIATEMGFTRNESTETSIATYAIQGPAQIRPIQSMIPDAIVPFNADQPWQLIDLPPTLVVDTTPYPVELAKNSESSMRYMQDKQMLVDYINGTKGLIPLEDVESIRIVLQRMFGYLVLRKFKEEDTWKDMLQLEDRYSNLGVVAEPSGQSWYSGIVTRKLVGEIAKNLTMMRVFAANSPQFAPQQLLLEQVIRRQPGTKPEEKRASIDYSIANITVASDFNVVPIDNTSALSKVHTRMHVLRKLLHKKIEHISERLTAIQNMAKEEAEEESKAEEVPPEGKAELGFNFGEQEEKAPKVKPEQEEKAATSVSPSQNNDIEITIENNRMAVVQQIEAVEAAFRNTLDKFKDMNRGLSKDDQATVVRWQKESRDFYEEIQEWGKNNYVPETNDPNQQTSRQTRNIIDQTVERTKKLTNDNIQSASGLPANIELKTAQPVDDFEMKEKLRKFRENITALQAVESNQKTQIRALIQNLKKEGFGIKKSIDVLNEESAKANIYSERMKKLTENASSCYQTFLVAALDPVGDGFDNSDKENEVTIDMVGNVHQRLRDSVECLSQYFKILQLAKLDVLDLEKNKQLQTQTEFQTQIEKLAKVGQIAVQEAESQQLMSKSRNHGNVITVATGQSTLASMKSDQATLDGYVSQIQTKLVQGGIYTKLEMDDMSQKAKDLLRKIARNRISFEDSVKTVIDQERIMDALHNNEIRISQLQTDAIASAKKAKEELDRAKTEYDTQLRLAKEANKSINPARRTSISFSNIESMAQKTRENFRLDVMEHITYAQRRMNEPPSLSNLQAQLKRMQDFEIMRADDMSRLPESDRTLFTNTTQELRTRIDDINKNYKQIASETQALKNLAAMTAIVADLNNLQTNVRDKNKKDATKTIASLAKHMKELPSYKMEKDAITLVAKAKKMIGDTKKASKELSESEDSYVEDSEASEDSE